MNIYDYPELIKTRTIPITEKMLREVEEHAARLRKEHDIRFKVPHVTPDGEVEEVEIRLIPIYDRQR